MKNIISTNKAPGAIGPYSQAVRSGNMLFLSGQLPIDKETGLMPESVDEQTRQSLENAKAIIESAGASLRDVVKTTVFLSDMGNFASMNEVYKEIFTENYPARSAVEVARLPKDALVEIEMIVLY